MEDELPHFWIEETLPDKYEILWRGNEALDALDFMGKYEGKNRIELWGKGRVDTEKVYAPLAYKQGEQNLKVSHTLTFLYLN